MLGLGEESSPSFPHPRHVLHTVTVPPGSHTLSDLLPLSYDRLHHPRASLADPRCLNSVEPQALSTVSHVFEQTARG